MKNVTFQHVAKLNVLSSVCCHKNSFHRNDPSDLESVMEQVLINQHYIMMLLLQQAGSDTTALEEKVEKIRFDTERNEWVID